ncbi:hypothetical protein [Mesorhizobium sp. L-8-3]|uniref:hypothetical protein n=1 Tax=Mesorhizobium sp. L-8-3 TaxID=2744522 RepID=UPI0019287876|nr:hypothetical protein [Mesorhizobium sp. L-8-3]BCH27555.1 hypothetical protein MesoLjLb_73400 [Mesorhizobium sp. L-8-3]
MKTEHADLARTGRRGPDRDRISGEARYLLNNDEGYRWLVREAQVAAVSLDAGTTLARVADAARFAAGFHTGRFADGSIENLALHIGASLMDRRPAPFSSAKPSGRRRVLQFASHLARIGGHTRMLQNWIKYDPDSCHTVVVSSQGGRDVPASFIDAVSENGGHLEFLPEEAGLIERSLRLRQLAREHADLVILHHDSSDVVPTVAFALDDLPPVAVLNHADFLFWLGSSVADFTINLRQSAADRRRQVPVEALLPVPLAESERYLSREKAREILGIPDNQVALLSIARAMKFLPSGGQNFIATAGRILDRDPRAHLYLVGARREDIRPGLGADPHERIHFVGPLDDPSAWRAAADIYLESFPFGSSTALLESTLFSLPVVRAYDSPCRLLVTDDDAIKEVVSSPVNEQGYIEQAVALIADADRRAAEGHALAARIRQQNMGPAWKRQLDEIYRLAEKTRHHPRRIAPTTLVISEEDIRLSNWMLRDQRGLPSLSGSGLDGNFLLHRIRTAREAGRYDIARRCAWKILTEKPLLPAAWRQLAASCAGR